MSDLIRRADAIEAVRVCDGRHETHDKTCRFIADVLLPALPSAEGGDAEILNEDFRPKYMQESPDNGADFISRDDAITALNGACSNWEDDAKVQEIVMAIPSAEAEPKRVLQGYCKGADCKWWNPQLNGCNRCVMIQDEYTHPSAEAVSREEYEKLYHKAEEVNDMANVILSDFPSYIKAVGYVEWLEKIIVDTESFEWLCEDTNDKEWCEKNCRYDSIQAECLRHLYEVSKGGDDECL